MFLLYWYPIGALVASAILALVITLAAAPRRSARLHASARRACVPGILLALAAGLLPTVMTLGAISSMLFGVAPWSGSDWASQLYDFRFAAGPIGGIAALLLWLVGTRNSTASGERSGILAPRTILSFSPRPLAATAAGFAGFSALCAVVAGSLSSRDRHGRFTEFVYYTINEGRGTSGIYGWNDSLPALAAIAVLIGLTVLALHRISRPPLAADAERDTAERFRAGGSMLLITIGAMSFHLAHVLLSFRSTVGSSFSLAPEEGSWIEISSPFAVFMPALTVASMLFHFCGGYAWFRVLWRGMLDGRSIRAARGMRSTTRSAETQSELAQ